MDYKVVCQGDISAAFPFLPLPHGIESQAFESRHLRAKSPAAQRSGIKQAGSVYFIAVSRIASAVKESN
jgi:hypothetical protein